MYIRIYTEMIPITKDIKNYRPIAIVPNVNKLLESCVSESICDFLHTLKNQLEFVRGSGCIVVLLLL